MEHRIFPKLSISLFVRLRTTEFTCIETSSSIASMQLFIELSCFTMKNKHTVFTYQSKYKAGSVYDPLFTQCLKVIQYRQNSVLFVGTFHIGLAENEHCVVHTL